MKGFPRRSKLTDEAPPRVLFELRPASELSTAALAQLFTAGYEGYELPIQVDEAAFAAMARLSDFDLDLSRLALRQGTPVGICVIGARGDVGWIGGLGVVPSSRRHGVGRRLMDAVLEAARAAAIGRVSLEVLERNAGAIALYDRLGFKGTRMLEVWSLSAEAGASGAVTESVSAAAEWIRANRPVPEPWQRADQSVENVVREGAEVEAVSLPGRGAALFRVSGEVASVLQLAARDVDSAAELLAAVRRRGRSLRFVNVPEGAPAAEALRKLGGDLELRQLEMALGLDTLGADTTGLDR